MVPAQPPEGTQVRKPREVPAGARVCVIASTAAVGNAVRRNRAKRRLREIFRHQQSAVPAECDLLLIARGAAVDVPMPISWPATSMVARPSRVSVTRAAAPGMR